MRISHLLLTAAISAASFTATAADITGTGSSFAYPIFSKWAATYKKEKGVNVNYTATGSSTGIAQISAKTVDFGASDKPLKQDVLDAKGLTQFPAIMGGVVPVINVKGIKPGQMRLSGEVLADIYLGKINKWNDPAIAKLNPSLKLPDEGITSVHRADGSGTTFIFTNYLSKVSKEWADKVGNDAAVSWPNTDSNGAGKGNAGVALYVQRIPGSIGYVEYAYAKSSHMTYTLMKNKDGHYVKPEIKTFQSAAAYADWTHAQSFYEILTNEPGKMSWPICGATFVLMQTKAEKPANSESVLKFFQWAFANGAKAAESLDYVPMPGNVAKLIETSWKSNIKDTSGAAVWK